MHLTSRRCPRRHRVLSPFALAVSALLALVSIPLLSLPASALAPNLPFTAQDLPTWQTNGVAWAVAGAQGLAFVGGTFSSIRPPGAAPGTGEVPVSNFVTLDAATGQPTSCQPTFTNPSNPSLATVRALTVSPDGKTLYAGGYFSTVNGIPDQHLAAIDIATCKVITSFKPKPNGYVYAIAATSTTVYYGGGFSQALGATRIRAAAASAVGTATPGALLPWAPTINADVFALGVNPDGSSVAIGGAFTNVNGTSLNALVVVDTAGGAIVKTFPGLIPPPVRVKAIAVDSQSFYEAQEHRGGSTENRIAIDWGTYNVRWNDSCQGANQALAIWKGVLYSGSHAHNCSSMGWFPPGPRHHLLAESTSDDTLQPWLPDTDDGIGEGIGPRGIAVSQTGSGDYLFVVGEFTAVNGNPQQGITRFGPPPDTTAPTPPLISVTSPMPGQARISWRQSTDTDDSTLTYQVFRDGNPNPLYTVTGSSWPWQRQQMDYIDTGLTSGALIAYHVTASDGVNTTSSASHNALISSSSSPYADRIETDGATMLYRYDDPADVFVSDATNADHNGTLQGVAAWGQPGAIAGDASSSIALSGNTTIYNELRQPSPTSFSVETWFKTTTDSGGKIIGFGDAQTYPSGNNDKNLYMANDGTLLFGVFPGSTVTIRSPKAYNDGKWHYVVASQGASGMSLYVDGSQVAHNSTTGNQNFAGYWHVGGDTLSGWPSQPSSAFFSGQLDETAVYPTALSASTIAAHYTLGTGQAPIPGPSDYYGRTVYGDAPSVYWRLGEANGTTALDSSGNSATGNYSSGVTLGRPSLVSGTTDTAAAFSGAQTIGSTNSVTSPDTFSAEAWFSTTTTSGGKILGFGSSRTSNSSTADRQVYMRNDGRLTFGVFLNDGTRVTLTSPSAYNDGQSHHVVATRNSSGMALYVDGVQVASNNITTPLLSYSGFWRVGGDRINNNWPSRPSSDYFTGTIDEFAVYPVALSSSTVAIHSSAGRATGTDVAPPTTPTSLTGSLNQSGVALHWTASLDNVGVTGYEVHRSSVSGFTPSPSTLIGTPGSTSFTDSSAPVGTQFYRVVAVDAAGNHSGPSSQFAITVVDTVPPSDPDGVTATTEANGTSIDVAWNASTDNVGVVDYSVHRGATLGFTPTAANRITTTSGTGVTDTPPGPGRWYYRVVARDAAGNASAGSNVAFADIADTTPPTQPTNLTATGGAGSVTLHWTAATDDSGSVSYVIYRSDTSGFTPDDSNKVGVSADTNFVDSPVAVGQWFYRVVAKDDTGNVGPASDEASATVSPAPPTVVTVNDTADTYANQGAPSTNFGTSASLFSRGTMGGISYMRFVLPAAPAGKSLVGATLQIRTTTDSTAGSTDTHTVKFADDTWNESTLTWNNRPALLGSPLGSISNATAISTTYTITLDASQLAAVLNSQISLGMTGSGTDSLWFWSSNHPNASFRPQLQLSFQ